MLIKGTCEISIPNRYSFKGDNLVLNTGKSVLAWPFSGFTNPASWLYKFGDSSLTVNEQQTGIQGQEIALNWAGATSVVASKPESLVLQITGSYANYADAASQVIREAVLEKGRVVSRILIPDLEILQGDNLEIKWRLRFEL